MVSEIQTAIKRKIRGTMAGELSDTDYGGPDFFLNNCRLIGDKNFVFSTTIKVNVSPLNGK